MANINHFDFKNYRVFETEIAGRKLTVETGKMAQLANGSCLVRYGETAVLVTATASAKPRDGIDFFPLSVDFEERMYAVGRIPGSFMRREGRPSEKAILSSRQIDRPMRPLFPKDLRNDVSIVCTVLENDYDNSPEVVALLGASIAVSISDIPFDYVVSRLPGRHRRRQDRHQPDLRAAQGFRDGRYPVRDQGQDRHDRGRREGSSGGRDV